MYISYLYSLVVSYRFVKKRRPEVDRVINAYITSCKNLSESDENAVIAQM